MPRAHEWGFLLLGQSSFIEASCQLTESHLTLCLVQAVLSREYSADQSLEEIFRGLAISGVFC